MNQEATNYNPLATIDDGSCLGIIYGCTNPLASNYNPSAAIDDGSCILEILGCMNDTATNYNPLATVDDGSCEINGMSMIYGCTNEEANNYNPLATVNDGSCTYDESPPPLVAISFDCTPNGCVDPGTGMGWWSTWCECVVTCAYTQAPETLNQCS
tara:strand:- start:104 stop:571 length:468 start_codon:yes stop_codon:yes gene_type:complete